MTGWSKIKELSGFDKKIKTAIVQPNIDPNTKWANKNKIIAIMDSLHFKSNKFKPDLVYHLAAIARIQPSFEFPKATPPIPAVTLLLTPMAEVVVPTEVIMLL